MTLRPADRLFIEIIKALYRGVVELYYIIGIKQRLQRSLLKNHHYYQALSKDRSEFARKVWQFIAENDFVPREGLKIGFKLKVIIASHAVQLSWRLPDTAYNYYEKIIVYREYYQSRLTRKLHKAEVNPGLRLIVFSVRAIHESLTSETKNVNVLIHEFAHALWLEHQLMHRSYNVFNPAGFEKVRLQVQNYFGKLQQQDEHFFRKYAFANEAEFFAVAVENFFGAPEAFSSELPDFYAAMKSLFLQDPLAIKRKMSNIAR
jgi:MtfA peptidase